MATDKPVQDMAQDTLSTLVGTNRFVMYDSTQGRTVSLTDVQEFIVGDLPERMDDAEEALTEEKMVVAVEYTSKTYAVGDYCMHGGILYQCTTAITQAEAWNAAHWTVSTVGTTNGFLIY